MVSPLLTELKQRCLVCDDVINPEDCNFSVQCDEDQVMTKKTTAANKKKINKLTQNFFLRFLF